ncbi:SprT family protein [Oceanobacillus halophilus]|uniref:SprT family protein n=1 Tax=Oceanobacillus halophilus TaxID=930130 RepID=A0A494ZWE5_9BACI|nr:SprT family protein [Oceanobacillus halophilus]RKQ30945.1 SprT family protein [Oceanobacillus halophilus]
MDPINEKDLYNLVNRLSIQFFNKSFRHKVVFNHRLRTTGGRYIPSKKVIELNPKYVQEMDGDEFIGIIKHELCHYHLHIVGKGYKHGDAAFKQLLKETGSPRHCNPLPSQRSQFNYLYLCKKCHFEYKRKRRVDVKKYRCGKCGGVLKLYTK